MKTKPNHTCRGLVVHSLQISCYFSTSCAPWLCSVSDGGEGTQIFCYLLVSLSITFLKLSIFIFHWYSSHWSFFVFKIMAVIKYCISVILVLVYIIVFFWGIFPYYICFLFHLYKDYIMFLWAIVILSFLGQIFPIYMDTDTDIDI